MPAPCRIAILLDPDALDPRQTQIVRGLARYAAQRGDWQLLFDLHAAARPPGLYAGCVAPAHRYRRCALLDVTTPLVCVDWALSREPLARVLDDRYDAGRLAAQHLLERGYRSFAYIGFTRHTSSSTESSCFRRELRRLGRPTATARTFVNWSRYRHWQDKVVTLLGEFLDRLKPPVGLFVGRPGLARAVADLALARGLRIPEDVGLVAADDDPVLCELPPALTSLHFDYAEVGVRAGQLLGRLMAGQRAPAKNVLVAPTLVPRLSTDRAAVADPLVAKALWFLDDRRTEAIRPRQVAEAVGLRLRALEGRLQRARGRTVAQEIARARVEHAKILLGDPGYSPCSVARQSGFGSYDALLRAFKRHAGMVPSAWQREALLRRRGAPDAETLRRRRRARRKRNGEA